MLLPPNLPIEGNRNTAARIANARPWRKADQKLYQDLDVHNSAELGTKIWLGEQQPRAN